jgi:hypothetical protein
VEMWMEFIESEAFMDGVGSCRQLQMKLGVIE